MPQKTAMMATATMLALRRRRICFGVSDRWLEFVCIGRSPLPLSWPGALHASPGRFPATVPGGRPYLGLVAASLSEDLVDPGCPEPCVGGDVSDRLAGAVRGDDRGVQRLLGVVASTS